MKKAEALTHWRNLVAMATKPRLRPAPIPYKHTGSTYGHDGIRIEGSPEFIDSILSRLGDLLAMENSQTRIGIAYNAVTPREGKPANGGDHVCYVKFHVRGHESQMARTLYPGIFRHEEHTPAR